MIATPDKRADRRRALETRFGAPTTGPGGRDRYQSTVGDLAYELLVDARTDLPVELNTSRAGKLVGHATFRHQAQPNGVLVRHLVHAEQALSDVDGGRSVMDVELTNVTLTTGGRR